MVIIVVIIIVIIAVVFVNFMEVFKKNIKIMNYLVVSAFDKKQTRWIISYVLIRVKLMVSRLIEQVVVVVIRRLNVIVIVVVVVKDNFITMVSRFIIVKIQLISIIKHDRVRVIKIVIMLLSIHTRKNLRARQILIDDKLILRK